MWSDCTGGVIGAGPIVFPLKGCFGAICLAHAASASICGALLACSHQCRHGALVGAGTVQGAGRIHHAAPYAAPLSGGHGAESLAFDDAALAWLCFAAETQAGGCERGAADIGRSTPRRDRTALRHMNISSLFCSLHSLRVVTAHDDQNENRLFYWFGLSSIPSRPRIIRRL
jgi:hypothetical protein